MVEILVAMTLAAIAIIGIMVLYMAQTRAAGFSRHSTEASVLAQDKIETLRTQGVAVNIPGVIEPTINERGGAGGIFKRTTTEVVLPNSASITVKVEWNDDGFLHQVIVYAQRDLP
jgi:hypothetical protein